MFDPVTPAALVVALGFVLYALFGGADFGGGIWTALAFGPRAREQREALFNAIGPVWETNHVWLIFVVVTLFTAFPAGFASLFIALMTPLVVALVGINFRGAAYAFRHYGRESGREVPFSARVFEIASVVTPFALGMAVAATAAGSITIDNDVVATGTGVWLTPFTVMGGVIALCVCAYLAPVYMAVRVSGPLQDDFRHAAIAAGIALGVVTSVMIPLALHTAPEFSHRLLGSWPMLCVVSAVLAGVATQLLLLLRRYRLAQVMAGATVVLTLAGFAAALSPDLIIKEMSLRAAAAPRATLIAYLTVLPVGAIILIPSLVFLFWTFRGEPAPELPPAGNEP
ncbi:cytochrome d ubiquinol oxidase subunit II [Geomonas nitrogeniifigens]|uniref:Cytochrome d ubiquinol oxidase subunit II n=1 Tax=Geomonas diazotrophica TaxID=2843197 RepID=A0ABX8JRL7_9BACT|nr:cytochrome d ubiquinol oxidase subunit II [Geomonas nitrogeniifigens]QWV99252.1 cytochrome d ubiquinol oxidase subunit II [Geomonas nitrogeniifigens]